jgi:hypothetical protein
MTDNLSNSSLDELGELLCSKIYWHGFNCEYIIGKNEYGSSLLILIIDGSLYTRTRKISYPDGLGGEKIYNLWEHVKIDYCSVFNRGISGFGVKYRCK